jgi:4-hydroxyphenylpyruvate dioxygenase-like putative hemolysin
MTPGDLNLLQSFITIQQEGPEVTEERKKSMENHCPPDIIHITNNMNRQQVDNWIRRFEKLTVCEKSSSLNLGMVSGGKNG